MTSQRAPDLIQKVLGFRYFRIEEDGRLLGRMSNFVWDDMGPTVARCAPDTFDWNQYVLPDPHDAPHRDCRCGLHAYSTLTRCVKYESLPVAAIAAWGVVVPHTDTFRASKAEVVAIYDLYGREKVARAADRYRAEVVHDLESLLDVGLKHAAPL